MQEDENSTLIDHAKSVALVLAEVVKILREEAESDEVTTREARQLEESRCFHRWDFDYSIIVLAPLGLFCILVLTLAARKHRSKSKRNTCDENMEVLVPLNVLTSYRNRMRYVLATTLIVYPCYQLLMAFAFPEITATFLFAITRVAKIITYGTVIYPIFVAINQKSLLASMVGCIMSVVLLATSIVPLRTCVDYFEEYATEIFARAPMMLCASAMAIVFVYDSVQHFRQGAYIYGCDNETYEDFVRGKLLYVKELFRREAHFLSPAQKQMKEAEESMSTNVFKKYIRVKKQRLMLLWKGHAGFKYPTRVLCTYVSLLVLMYYLIYQVVLFEKETIGKIDDIIHKRVAARLNRSSNEFFADAVKNSALVLESKEDYLQILSHGLTIVEECFYVSIAFTAIVHLLMIASMMLNYRENVIRAYRGNFHHILPRSKMNPASVVIGFTRYCGYQISFITYSFIFQSFVYTLMLFLAVQLVLLPIRYGYESPLQSLIERIWPTLIITTILFLSQILVTRLVFVSNRDKQFEIVHRNAFFIWSYYLFLINALIGLIACFLRIFKAAFIAFVSMGRLDWCHLPGKFVTLDPGYLSYVGQIHIDTLHSNPIVLTFSYYIRPDAGQCSESDNGHKKSLVNNGDAEKNASNAIEKTKRDDAGVNSEAIELVSADAETHAGKSDQILRRERLRRRWFVAYSIMKNPSIRHLRKKSSRMLKTISEHCLPLAMQHDQAYDSADKSDCNFAV